MEKQEIYEANYDPNDIRVNAPDFEEPHVEDERVANFNYEAIREEPMHEPIRQEPKHEAIREEVYRNYYDEMKNKRVETQVPKTLSPQKENQESNNKTFKLLRPFEFEGELISEVYLDFDSLTGKDIMEASKGIESFVQETDKTYLCKIAASAMGRPKEIMYYMSAKDVTSICYFVADFLID